MINYKMQVSHYIRLSYPFYSFTDTTWLSAIRHHSAIATINSNTTKVSLSCKFRNVFKCQNGNKSASIVLSRCNAKHSSMIHHDHEIQNGCSRKNVVEVSDLKGLNSKLTLFSFDFNFNYCSYCKLATTKSLQFRYFL